MEKWNDGRFPTNVGFHNQLSIFDAGEVFIDNGCDTRTPVNLSVSLHVERKLYYGMFPITQISGFKDEIRGNIITNAFTTGLLNLQEVKCAWQEIKHETDAPLKPTITLTGLVGWVK